MTRPVITAVNVVHIQLFLALVTMLTLCKGRLALADKRMIKTSVDVTGNYNCGLEEGIKIWSALGYRMDD